MFERAGNDVGAATNHRLQGLGAPREVGDADVQPFVLEIAAGFRDGQGEIVDQRLAADGDLDLGLFQLLGAHNGGRHAHDAGGTGHLEQITASD
ncbi:hypothetical protein D9M68_940120 [compost metagenome]